MKFKEGIEPNVDNDGIPRCAYEECQSYDGKRCGLMGFKPDAICEPAIFKIVQLLKQVKALVND